MSLCPAAPFSPGASPGFPGPRPTPCGKMAWPSGCPPHPSGQRAGWLPASAWRGPGPHRTPPCMDLEWATVPCRQLSCLLEHSWLCSLWSLNEPIYSHLPPILWAIPQGAPLHLHPGDSAQRGKGWLVLRSGPARGAPGGTLVFWALCDPGVWGVSQSVNQARLTQEHAAVPHCPIPELLRSQAWQGPHKAKGPMNVLGTARWGPFQAAPLERAAVFGRILQLLHNRAGSQQLWPPDGVERAQRHRPVIGQSPSLRAEVHSLRGALLDLRLVLVFPSVYTEVVPFKNSRGGFKGGFAWSDLESENASET